MKSTRPLHPRPLTSRRGGARALGRSLTHERWRWRGRSPRFDWRHKVLKDIIEEGLGKDQEKADFVNVKGYVTFVKHEKWCYPADPETRRKLTWDASAGKNGVWRNETDGRELESLVGVLPSIPAAGLHLTGMWVR